MTRKCLALFLSLLIVSLATPAATLESDRDRSEYSDEAGGRTLRPVTGFEEIPVSNPSTKVKMGASRSPGTVIGQTEYDYQQNASMGRQVVYTFEGTQKFCGVHFVWMCLPCPETEPTYRHVKYNAVDCSGNWTWGTGPEAGKPLEYVSGGYCSIDATHFGAAVYRPVVSIFLCIGGRCDAPTHLNHVQ